MANIYARETALKNVVGRSDYISNSSRQEEIVFHKENMEHSWQDYADFEKQNKKSSNENIQARETVVALPNDLYKYREELERFCDRLSEKMYGMNRDVEYAVHWNSDRTNLHAHFIYSERERNQERQAKVYKRDIWADSKTGRTCKKDSPNAILRCKKGDIQKDKDGNIKYDDNPFTAKDKKYHNKNWLTERNKLIQDVFREFKHNINIFDRNTQIAQKKLTKGCSDEFKKYATEYNRQARTINRQSKVLNQVEPVIKDVEEKNKQRLDKHDEKQQLNKDYKNKGKLTKALSNIPVQIGKLDNEIKELIAQMKPLINKATRMMSINEVWRNDSKITDIVSDLSTTYNQIKNSLKTSQTWINKNNSFSKYLDNKASQKQERLVQSIEKDKQMLEKLQNRPEKFSIGRLEELNKERKAREQKRPKRQIDRSDDLEI